MRYGVPHPGRSSETVPAVVSTTESTVETDPSSDTVAGAAGASDIELDDSALDALIERVEHASPRCWARATRTR